MHEINVALLQGWVQGLWLAALLKRVKRRALVGKGTSDFRRALNAELLEQAGRQHS